MDQRMQYDYMLSQLPNYGVNPSEFDADFNNRSDILAGNLAPIIEAKTLELSRHQSTLNDIESFERTGAAVYNGESISAAKSNVVSKINNLTSEIRNIQYTGSPFLAGQETALFGGAEDLTVLTEDELYNVLSTI